ncbi:MAG: tetratricopeptide repeat protein [Candidatus Hodarchaeota archaeon]
MERKKQKGIKCVIPAFAVFIFVLFPLLKDQFNLEHVTTTIILIAFIGIVVIYLALRVIKDTKGNIKERTYYTLMTVYLAVFAGLTIYVIISDIAWYWIPVMILLTGVGSCVFLIKGATAKTDVRRANDAYNGMRYKEAISLWNKIIEKEPEEPSHWHNLALSYKRLRNVDGALQAYSTSLQKNPRKTSNEMTIVKKCILSIVELFNSSGRYHDATYILERELPLGLNIVMLLENLQNQYTFTLEYHKRFETIEKLAKLEPKWKFELAIMQQNKGRKQDALLMMKDLASQQSPDPAHVAFYALLLHLNGEIKESIDILKNCMQQQPSAGSLALLARILSFRGNLTGEKPNLQELIKIIGIKVQDLKVLAHILGVANMVEESMEMCRTILERNPDDYFGNVMSGMCHRKQGQFTGFIESFKRAVKAAIPQMKAFIYYDCASISINKGNEEDFLSYLDLMKKLDPEHTSNLLMICKDLLGMKFNELGKVTIEKTIRALEKNGQTSASPLPKVKTLVYLALCKFHEGDLAGAESVLKEAMMHDPGNFFFPARILLKAILAKRQRTAVDAADMAIIDFGKPDMVKELSWLLVNIRETSILLHIAKKMVNLFPQDKSSWRDLGNAYHLLHDHEDAARAYQEAVSLDEMDYSSRENLGYHLCMAGNVDEGKKILSKLVKDFPEYQNAWLGLCHAILMEEQPDIDGARKVLDRATAMGQTRPNYLYNRACFLAMEGNYDDAIELLKKAVTRDKIFVGFMKREPLLERIRADSRFNQILQGN